MERQDAQQRYEDQGQERRQGATGRGSGPAGDAVAGYAVVDIWTFALQDPLGSTDLTGFSVEASDGGIGKVDEATKDAGSSYLIVDTGPWIFGKTVMLPAGVVTGVDLHNKTVHVNRTKDEIKDAPQYDPKRGHQDQDYRDRLGGYYGARSGRR